MFKIVHLGELCIKQSCYFVVINFRDFAVFFRENFRGFRRNRIFPVFIETMMAKKTPKKHFFYAVSLINSRFFRENFLIFYFEYITTLFKCKNQHKGACIKYVCI